MKDMSALQLVVYVVFLAVVLLAWSATGHDMAVRADLTHIDSAGGFSKRDLLRRMAARTQARVDKQWAPRPRPRPRPGPGGADDTAAVIGTVFRDVNNSDSEYLIHLSIGTSPQRVALTLDTGSDLIWTQCGCSSSSCLDQPFPTLNTSASGTHRGYSCFDPLCAWGGFPLSGCTVNDNVCFYVHSNGGDTFTSGKISEDTFTFQAPGGDDVPVPSLRFGCGMYNTGNFKSNESGVAGFGRGPMSLPSQLKVRRFSYCFTTIGESSRASPVFLGSYGNLEAQATGTIQSTPFVPTPEPEGPNSSLYYLSLQGITVGDRRLPFDASTFKLRGDGSGGTIIDSGTGITTFPRAVFRTLREEFISQVSLPVADDDDPDSMLCFSTSPHQNAPYVPPLILHLKDADWNLGQQNYVMNVEGHNGTGSRLCVVINSAGDTGVTIIGNFQQQNMHIAYDLGSNRLFFVPARCDKL